jgi:hypothetical protein
VDSLAPGEKDPHFGEEHRTEVTEGGILSFDGGWFFGGPLGFLARKTRIEESVAQRSRRSQRGDFELRRRMVLWGTAWLLGEKDTHRGEHRTEVTEVTEGIELAPRKGL